MTASPARTVSRAELLVALVFLAAGLALAPLVVREPTLAVGLLGGSLLVLACALRPVWALTAFIAVNPLLVGLGRGAFVPGLRLNEVLLIPVLAGVGVAVLVRWHRSGWVRPRGFHVLDVVVVALAVTSSVTTLLWMYARGREITADDLLYALALWKLAVLYAAVRLALREARDIRRILGAVLATTCLIGAIGVLQAVGYGPAIDLLDTWVPAEEGGYEIGGNRATATLGNPLAYGDVLLYSSVVSGSLAARSGKPLLWILTVVLALGTLASGQFSMLAGILAAAVAFAIVTRMGKQLALAGATLLAVAYVTLRPVLAARTEAADPSTGLPVSWTGRYGRLDNLERYFWPEIGQDFNWLFGVQTSSRLPGHESWREWVYIESGYTWTLWNGGLPLLAATFVLLVVMARTGRRLLAAPSPTRRALGTTLAVVPWALGVLLVLDPHLTLRGGADLLFVLLALGATLDAGARAPTAARTVAHPRVGGQAEDGPDPEHDLKGTAHDGRAPGHVESPASRL